MSETIKKVSWLRSMCVAMLIATILYALLAAIVQPKWFGENQYDRELGFYEEPLDTIEVAFLGTSHVMHGIATPELYRDYGICAYNFGSSSQAMVTSYTWLQEVYRLHQNSLRTVVLDTSGLRLETKDSFHWMAVDGMHLSKVKIEAVKEYFSGAYRTGDWKSIFAHLNPMIAYHMRWKELTTADFEYETPDTYLRGYAYSNDHKDYWRYSIATNLNMTEHPEGILDVNAMGDAANFNEEQLYYYHRIVDFCCEKRLHLILTMIPTCNGWNSAHHKAVEQLALADELVFIDFNFTPYYDVTGDYIAAELYDISHLNHYGAVKVTSFLGNYMIENEFATDVRGQESYSFMDDELADYQTNVTNAIEYGRIASPEEYLQVASADDGNVIFIMVKNDVATSLTSDQKLAFAKMGLTQFQDIRYPKEYLAVIDDGEVIYEKLEDDVDPSDENQKAGEVLTYDGKLSDGTRYWISSDGYNVGGQASCIINEEEYAPDESGLNIVVYNKNTHEIVDSTCFDTCASSTRRLADTEYELKEALAAGKTYDELTYNSKLLYKYAYRVRCATAKKKLHMSCGNDGLLEFLDAYMTEGKTILISVKGDAAGALTDEAKEEMWQRDLQILSEIKNQDSYIGIVKDGAVIYEESDCSDMPIAYTDIGYTLTSGGAESGDVSSVQIGGTEYSPMSRGINIVVYDEFLGEVVDQASFDTSEVPVRE